MIIAKTGDNNATASFLLMMLFTNINWNVRAGVASEEKSKLGVQLRETLYLALSLTDNLSKCIFALLHFKRNKKP